MASTKLTALTSATSLAGSDLVYVVEGGVSKSATKDVLLADSASSDELNTTNHNLVLTNWQMQNQLNLTQLPQKDGFVDYFVDETHTDTGNTTLVYDAAGDLYTNPAVVAAGGYDFNVEMNLANGTTAMNDLSQNSLTITGYGGIDFETDAGAYNGASTSLVFDGSTQYIATADFADFDLGATDDIILEIAFNQDVTTGVQNLMSRWEATTNKKSISLQANAGDLDFYISTDGTTDGAATKLATGVFSASTWYHVLVIYERQTETVKTYIDGKFVGEVSETRTPFATDIGWSIGARRTGSADAADSYFDGKIGLARIASGDKRYLGTADTDSITRGEAFVLDATGNADASTTFTDLSTNASVITAFGGASWSNDASPYSDNHATSLDLDGTDDYLSVDSTFFDNTGDITLEMIVNFDSTEVVYLVSQDGVSSNRSWAFNFNASLSNMTMVRSSDGTNIDTSILVTGLSLSINTWYHIRITYDNDTNTAKVYVDGDLKGSDAGNSVTSLFSTTIPIQIGARTGNNDYMDGRIAGCKITNAIVPATMLSDYESLKQFPVDNDTNYDHLVLDMNQVDGSTTFTDLSANNTTITAIGTPSFSREGTYVPNRAVLRLNGTNQALEIDDTGFDADADFTFETIFRYAPYGGTNINFFTTEDDASSGKSLMILINSLGDINLYRSSTGTSWDNSISIDCGENFNGTNIGEWMHVRVTYDKSESRIRAYKNGVELGTNTGTAVTVIDPPNNYIRFFQRGADYDQVDIASIRLSNGIQEPLFFNNPYTDLTVTPPSSNGNYVSLTEVADTAPSEIRLLCLIQTDGTLNTDVIGEVSRDGGTTWTAVTLQYTVAFEGSVNCAASDPVSVAGQPSGTNIVGRIRSLNEANTDIHGISMGW